MYKVKAKGSLLFEGKIIKAYKPPLLMKIPFKTQIPFPFIKIMLYTDLITPTK